MGAVIDTQHGSGGAATRETTAVRRGGLNIEVWHTILWSRYKGRVFSALHRIASAEGDRVHVVQQAETEQMRVGLGTIEHSYHQYPYEVLFPGSLDTVPAGQAVRRFFRRGLSSKADFVLLAAFSHPRNWAQLLGLMLKGTPRGVISDSTLADQPPSWWKHILKRIFFRRCDLILCYGERARDYLIHHGADPARIHFRRQAAALPDGYDPDAIEELRVAKRSATPRLLYVGRLSHEKNLNRLIEAFARYRAEQSDAELRLVGAGPHRPALEAQAASLGLGSSVVFAGSTDQAGLAEEYLAATCFVLPSTSEPWGLVVNEALSYGCPVAVSDACGCVPELVDPAVTGPSFDPYDVDDIVAALRLIDRDFGDARAVARACLDRIAGFTPEVAARQMLDAIRKVLAERRR